MKSLLKASAAWAAIFLLSNSVAAQSPGQIVRRASVNTVLDPVTSTGYTSATTSGFSTNDITESRLPFKVITLPFAEPIGDLATGANGGFTDLVTSPSDKSGLMVYYDNTNLIFRLRVGSISSGAKGYSVLIDIDNRAGNSGPQADPNYVAPTSQGSGNIGFEYEVLLSTGNTQTITLYETDGKAGVSIVQANQVTNNNYQISQALTTNSGNPDYFYDFYVPFSWFSGAITASSKLRMLATTVNSPTSALKGSRSDIFGADDRNYATTPDEWLAVLNGTPPVTLTTLAGNTPATIGYCTAAPTLTGPIQAGASVTISGTWTRTDNTRPSTATINLYKYVSGSEVLVSSVNNVSSGAGWSIAGLNVSSGESYFARAVASNESECMMSNMVVSTCASVIASPTITCASSKGIVGTIPAGSTILVYNTSTGASPTANQLVTGSNTNYNGTTFNFWGTNAMGSATTTANPVCNGQNDFATPSATIMLVAQNGGCLSAPTYLCVASNSYSSLTTGSPSITTPVYANAQVSGTGASSGQILRLYVDGNYTSSITATGSSFTFPYTALTAGQSVQVQAQGTSTTCATWATARTVVCYTAPPVVTTDNNGYLIAGNTSISGTATPGASISVNRTAPSAAGPYTATANASTGVWSVTVPAMVAGQTYTATATSGGCTSAATSAISVVGAAQAVCPVITSTITETTSPFTVNGTVDNSSAGTGTVRLYYDGILVASTPVSTTGSSVSWSISVPAEYSPYTGGVLNATYQAGSSAEYLGCSSSGTSYTTVVCSVPSTPTIVSRNPATGNNVNVGATVSYTIGNVQANTWYSLRSTSGSNYATAQYATTTSNLTMTTRAFSTTGTYNVVVTADRLSGCNTSTVTDQVNVVAVTLPVQLSDFWGKRQGSKNLLQWITSSEINTDHFVVERSGDGIQFTSLGNVPAKGQAASYSFTDPQPLQMNYYQLRIVDRDGRSKLSRIIWMTDQPTTVLQTQPNPFSKALALTFAVPQSSDVEVKLSDMNGRVLYQQKQFLQAGVHSRTIDQMDALTPGIYLLTVFNGREVLSQKMVKK